MLPLRECRGLPARYRLPQTLSIDLTLCSSPDFILRHVITIDEFAFQECCGPLCVVAYQAAPSLEPVPLQSLIGRVLRTPSCLNRPVST